ncbi:hypothetical protein Mx8p18 [Myxococcus phage Mx8]|uniref:p18 n=1 Tax=Myxococcus phage Mx8 TaxID=49964 RepID=Q94MV1_9CAUD|nr:hypothetical protein Mx8p18 [Myxococcus phage Mx8]AAK94353.1 p18 [Myxococcus phage Mx8]
MTCIGIHVTASGMRTATKALRLDASEVQRVANLRWAKGRGLADFTGPVEDYLLKSARLFHTTPRLHGRQVWWFGPSKCGSMALVYVELLSRPLWERHLAELAAAQS